jgi:hypothetical protein
MSLRASLRACYLIPVALAQFLGGQSANARQPDTFIPDPFYLTSGTFALDPLRYPDTGEYRIATFLPHHSLIFKEKAAATVTIGGQAYTTMITQHGERYLIPAKVISSKPFSSVYGELQTIVFHEDAFICPSTNVECDDSTGDEVLKGQVFQKVEGPVLELKTFDADRKVIDGFLTSKRFNAWKAEGVISDVSEGYPRFYVLSTKKLTSLTTARGEERTNVTKKSLTADLEGSAEPGDLFSILTRISGILKLNLKLGTKAEFEKSETIESKYGDKDAQLEFSKIDLFVFDKAQRTTTTSDTRTLLVASEIQCLGRGVGARPAFIKSVQVNEGDHIIAARSFSDFYSVKASDTLKDTDDPFDVYILNGGHAFLTSITSPRSYSRIIHKWSHNLDHDIAAILMGTFNVSCPNKLAGDESAIQKCNNLLESPPAAP